MSKALWETAGDNALSARIMDMVTSWALENKIALPMCSTAKEVTAFCNAIKKLGEI
jgi:hypothetical protein